MDKRKRGFIFIVIGFILVLQFQCLKMLGLIHLSSEWRWSSDVPAMLSVIGVICLFIGLYFINRARKISK